MRVVGMCAMIPGFHSYCASARRVRASLVWRAVLQRRTCCCHAWLGPCVAWAIGIVDAIGGDAAGWTDDMGVGLMCGFAKIEGRERVEILDFDEKY